MKTAHKVWNKQEILRLIQRYQQYEILWNTKIPQYKNRALKQESLRELSLEFKTPVSEIQRKVHNLRCQLNSEVKKLRKRKNAGLDDGSLKSSWEYFEPLLFILSASSKEDIDNIDDMEGFDISDHLETMIESDDTISIKPEIVADGFQDSTMVTGDKTREISDQFQTMIEANDLLRIKAEDNEDYQDSKRMLGEIRRAGSDHGDTQSDLSQENTKDSVPGCSRFKDSPFDSIYSGLRAVTNVNSHEMRRSVPLKKRKFLETLSGHRDDCQIFGDFVASELRNLKSDDNKRKLKLIIQKAILEVTESEVRS